MFNIIVYLSIFCLIIYLVFQGLVKISTYFFLIDEHFVNKLKDINDNLTNRFLNENDTINVNNTINDTKNKNKRLNTYLRFDFFISLFLGIIWFIFPGLLFKFTPIELQELDPENRYLGQMLGILVLLTTILPIKTIQKNNTQEKKMVIGTKLFCAIIILLIQFIYIYYIKRINYNSILTLVFISIWMSNSILGINV